MVFFLKFVTLGVNITAIYYAFLTYRSGGEKDWQFEMPCRIAVWAEFLGLNVCMLAFLYKFIFVVGAAVNELRAPYKFTYKRNLEFCGAVWTWYTAAMKLEFNLLYCVRYINPARVTSRLRKATIWTYSKFGVNRKKQAEGQNVGRGNIFTCCLGCVSLLGWLTVLVLTAASVMAVILKLLQLRFVGSIHIRDWGIPELLLFAQFLVNVACLDTKERGKLEGKLELLFAGADAEEQDGEAAMRALVDHLALLVLRYHYSMLTAVAILHCVTSADVSFLYIHDQIEENLPREVPMPAPLAKPAKKVSDHSSNSEQSSKRSSGGGVLFNIGAWISGGFWARSSGGGSQRSNDNRGSGGGNPPAHSSRASSIYNGPAGFPEAPPVQPRQYNNPAYNGGRGVPHVFHARTDFHQDVQYTAEPFVGMQMDAEPAPPQKQKQPRKKWSTSDSGQKPQSKPRERSFPPPEPSAPPAPQSQPGGFNVNMGANVNFGANVNMGANMNPGMGAPYPNTPHAYTQGYGANFVNDQYAQRYPGWDSQSYQPYGMR
ncbi:hypothetical protein GPECTOR_3g148 [Gonium pectorale]|uniref:Uncharacterized protein n=1 Tax=Gonium pectorale TaxID=33097 RepID=A0A150GZ44_GONPE|nr:hypothetical protein GPECTOR_3g148 [Gonium pectorale]|eukprot:KXZ54982.1 hypothetical protein GPECTOR_3g148 [Gonium pectorale]